MGKITLLAKKEFRGFFASPAAYLFMGAFLLASLFCVFWVETFFARNLADLRALFTWMPTLLIFFTAALTMRSWAEERRAGTLESLLTAPVTLRALILGKFLGALALLALTLALTLPLPLTVSLLGPLDWGPVVGGYLATLALGSTYLALGLYCSARTDNPVVALITTVALASALHLVGSDSVTQLFAEPVASLLSALGTQSHFDAVTRGVLALEDLVYTLSLAAAFLIANSFALARLRWQGDAASPRGRRARLAALVLGANVLLLNFWVGSVASVRLDLTADGRYSLSEATAQSLANLEEPLTLRAYFSAKTHPLLAPLVPQLKDLLAEYAVLGGDRVRVEIIDPQSDPALEEEAAERYGIRPVPFQTADRYEAAVVNAYFDLVVAYGDSVETLSFQDLIDVKARGEGDLEVTLKNPEYALTRAIRKAQQSFFGGGNVLDAYPEGVTVTAYLSPEAALPPGLQVARAALLGVLEDRTEAHPNAFRMALEDPAQNPALAERLEETLGLGPLVLNLLDPQPFWFSLVLDTGTGPQALPLPEGLEADDFERLLDAALKRGAPGVLQQVTVLAPEASGPPGLPGAGDRFAQLEAALEESFLVVRDDLRSGRVPPATDALLVLAPENLDDRQRFAIDQFLMRGGAAVLTTSPFKVSMTRGLTAQPQSSGLEPWLETLGLTFEKTFVLDPQNAALPIPVERMLGGLPIQEIRMLDYPPFPDLRDEQLNPSHPITQGLGQLTLNWASPLKLRDAAANEDEWSRTVLLQSSAGSEQTPSINLIPDYDRFPTLGFPTEGERGSAVLAVALEGRFPSAFAGEPSPLATEAAPEDGEDEDAEVPEGKTPAPAPVLTRAPEGSKLVVLASNSFASDTALELASQGQGSYYTQPIALVQNALDYALEEDALLSLRGRSALNRSLLPLSPDAQQGWESLNYGAAVVGLILVALWRRTRRRAQRARFATLTSEVSA